MRCARTLPTSWMLVLSFAAQVQCVAIEEPDQLLHSPVSAVSSEDPVAGNVIGRKLSNVVFHHKGRHLDIDYLEIMTLFLQRGESLSSIKTPGPEWRFVPEFLGAAYPGKAELQWTAPCFDHVLEPRMGGSYVVEWQGLESVRTTPPISPNHIPAQLLADSHQTRDRVLKPEQRGL